MLCLLNLEMISPTNNAHIWCKCIVIKLKIVLSTFTAFISMKISIIQVRNSFLYSINYNNDCQMLFWWSFSLNLIQWSNLIGVKLSFIAVVLVGISFLSAFIMRSKIFLVINNVSFLHTELSCCFSYYNLD